MTEEGIKNGFKVFTITSEDQSTSASFIPERGGIGTSLTMHCQGHVRELLYQHDFLWDEGPLTDLPGGWPFLFPICGRLERDNDSGVYLYDGQRYHLPIHGVAPYQPWMVVKAGRADLIMELTDSEETRTCYPFEFVIRLHYEVSANCMSCRMTCQNRGDTVLPYYAGFHPYFRLPDAESDWSKVQVSCHPSRRLHYNERLVDVVGDGDVPGFPTSVTDPDINEILTMIPEPQTLTLNYPDGMQLELTAEGVQGEHLFPYVQLYRMPDKPFFCAEPWMGHPNAMNTCYGVRRLEPGEKDEAVITVSVASSQ